MVVRRTESSIYLEKDPVVGMDLNIEPTMLQTPRATIS